MTWLRRVAVDRTGVDLGEWPWSLAAVAAIQDLTFGSGVTFLAGENGTGKSTVLEAIAVACGCPVEGGASNPTLKGPRRGDALPARMRPVLEGVPVGGAWFLRAETFFDLATAAEEAAENPRPYLEDAQLLADFGGRSPHLLSHGQAFLKLFDSRMGAQSLWFMDEPEAPLSFRSQLALLGLLHGLVTAGSQFVVATHSPVLLAFPGATIYEVGADAVQRREWPELDLVRDVRAFLDAPERFFRYLFDLRACRFEELRRAVFHGRIGPKIHRLASQVAGQIRGLPLAAALFEPNVVRAGGPGLVMLALPFDWRRQDKAIAAGIGLAPESLLVVTADHVYAFDASLLRWRKILRKLGEWPRAELVARAVALPGPIPPRWAETRYHPGPGLRLENAAGVCLAEVRPLGWGEDAKEVFRLLTGSAGRPDPGAPA